MKRIDDRTVELTDEEQAICDTQEGLLDQGYSTVQSVSMIRNAMVPPLDAVLTTEFLAYLSE